MAQQGVERRRYIRLNSCFPVEFSLYFTATKPISEPYQAFTCNVSEGGLCITVRNLRPEDEELILKKRARLGLTINMPLFTKPAKATADIAWCKKDETSPSQKTYLIGLCYQEIDPADKNRIVNYARRLKWLPRLAYATIAILVLGLIVISLNHLKVAKENRLLVERLVSISEIKDTIARQLNETKVRKEMLEARFIKSVEETEDIKTAITDIEAKAGSEKERLVKELGKVSGDYRTLEEKIKQMSAQTSAAIAKERKSAQIQSAKLKDIISTLEIELAEINRKSIEQLAALNQRLKNLEQENTLLKQNIALTEKDEVSLEERLAEIRAKSGVLEKANIDKMLGWIKTHRTKRTALVLSYEGDDQLKDWGFTYDEALAAQVFLISGEMDKAKDILLFYTNQAKSSDGLFYNAYDVATGSPCEYMIHGGPNIWLGISACQYVYRTKDKEILNLAEDIAARILKLQKLSNDGGIRGGPDVTWVSTEHNLDAYALFNMLYTLTNKQEYKEAASSILNWLKNVGYNRPEGYFMRGKGDATIATDTFSWAIAAVGPDVLKENGMDPDDIMEFAENECRVSAKFIRPDNRAVDVVGFDFTKPQNIARGGIVSTEWTAQMIVAFKIMAGYHRNLGEKEKEEIYKSKAQYYLSQLSKMVISSPSPTGQGEGCLPYASIDNVDTGHGWRVAKGRRTGSVAATAYYIFAYKNHNPLVL